MIGIKHLKGSGPAAAAAVAEYLKALRNAKGIGYYSEKGGAPSRWLGEGAKRLGLEGQVDEKALTELLQGRLPDGTDISDRGGRKASRRMGTDLTISAPKSFSMLVSGAPPEEKAALMRLWDEAMAEGLKVVEKEVIVARRGKGGASVEHTGVMVAAVFTHEDARPVDGIADMDIHGHAIILNQTQRADGTWVARDLDFGQRNVLRMTADFATKAHLAKGLQERGYGVRQTRDGFEMSDVADEQIKTFSRRKEQVDAALESKGLTRESSSSAQREAANLATRESKRQLSQDEQRWEWRARLREAGLDIDAIIAQAKERGPIQTPDLTSEAVASAARHCSERESVFSQKQARFEALKAGMGGVTLESIDAAIQTGTAGLVNVGGDRLITKATLMQEYRVIETAKAGRDGAQAIMSKEAAEAFIAQREAEQGFTFSRGQREALALGLTSNDKVFAIEGAAGVGKTTSMKPLISAMRAGGYEVVGVAPTTDATTQLRGAGADDTRTLQSYLMAPVPKDPKALRFVVLDEAGKVSTSDVARLQKKLAQMPGTRLLLTGDYHQTPSVEAGSPFKALIESKAIKSVKITEVQRQKDAGLKDMAQAWADVDIPKALEKARDYMTQVEVPFDSSTGRKKPNTDERRAALATAAVNEYLSRDSQRRESTLMMAGTNDVRRRANDLVRAGLKERGVIHGPETTIRALDSKDITKEAATQAVNYAHGEVVRLTEGRGRRKTTTDYMVAEVRERSVVLENEKGEKKTWYPHKASEGSFQIFTEREMKLGVGDAIQIRANAGNKRDPSFLGNGQVGKIVALNEDGPQVKLDDGREVTLKTEGRHCLDYGWCRTVSKAQGSERPPAILIDEASKGSSAELANVGLTRASLDLVVFTDSPDRTVKSWEKWAERETALEAMRKQGGIDPDRVSALRNEIAHEVAAGLHPDFGMGQLGDLSKARDQHEEPVELAQARQERELLKQREAEREIER